MPEGFEVVAAELEGHASAVEGFADDVGEAVEAGMQTIQPDTYGVFCQSAAAVAGGLELAGSLVLKDCAETLRTMAASLRTTARVYSDTEQSTRSTFAEGVR